MKIHLTIITTFAAVFLFGANVPSEKFVSIPANPTFSFASTLERFASEIAGVTVMCCGLSIVCLGL